MSFDSDNSQYAPHDHNRRAWNALVARKNRFTWPAKEQELREPLKTVDASGWLGPSIAGWRVLCLAAGGGRQSALYAAAGAKVTVVDISPAMLAIDREIARQHDLDVTTVEASMDDLSMLAPASFELVIHPVSTCYLPDVQKVYAQVARVTKPGGLYVSQHKSPTSLQTGVQPGTGGRYELEESYYRTGPLPAVVGSLHREAGTLEFLHRWEDLLGGMCRAGFAIEDLTEPRHAESTAVVGEFRHRSQFVAPYVRIKARRHGGKPATSVASEESDQPARKIWMPE
jgi:SAM-dependent methyltransferase